MDNNTSSHTSRIAELKATTQAMVAKGKGLLAADESFGTIRKRFQEVGIADSEENRRAYRELLFSTPGIEQFLSGVILFDETIRQSTQDGTPMPQLLNQMGIIPGIKVDKGTVPLAKAPGEVVTEGLDGLRDRLQEYYRLGARFTKWRAVINISEANSSDITSDITPTTQALQANAHALARYAALCQEAGLVPIVEPEVLLDGNHTLERSFEVHEATLHHVFEQLEQQKVDLDQMILKPSMVVPGKNATHQSTVDEVAAATVKCLLNQVPMPVLGCAFLSGGQSDQSATAHLNAMNRMFKGQLPWTLTFSYSRALQQAAMQTWKGQPENIRAAQKVFYHRAECNSKASLGEYTSDMEKVPVVA
jgi:fructose-bisphosphate aldolase class I